MMQTKVMVTGAAGLVGGELVRQLIEQRVAVEVVCVVRGVAAEERLRRRLGQMDRVQFEYVDLEDFEQVRQLVQRVEPNIVFHAAAKVSVGDSPSDRSGQRMIEGNQDITHFMCEALLETKRALLVHVSSIAALGTDGGGEGGREDEGRGTDARGGADEGHGGAGRLIDETTPFTDFDRASAYTRSKFLCHQEVVRAAKMGLRTVVVCPSVVVGVGSGLGQMDVLFGWIRRGLPVATRGEMGYVDVRDVARAMIALAQEPQAEGECYLLNGANLTFGQFVEVFGRPWGKRAPRYRVGRRVLGVAGVACRAWTAVFGGTPLVTRAVADYLCDCARYDGSKIGRTIVGFSYTPIEETARYVAQYLGR